jgi:hypothetical protein
VKRVACVLVLLVPTSFLPTAGGSAPGKRRLEATVMAWSGVDAARLRTSARLPALLACRAVATVTLRVRNRGHSARSAVAPPTLRAESDAVVLASPAIVGRTGGGRVLPGHVASFMIRLRAPARPTLLRPRWHLYLGETATSGVVGGPVQIYCDTGSGINGKVLAGY